MPKLPWVKFWHRDWLADKDIRRTKDYARAYWMDTLCYFWEAGVYQMKHSVHDWAAMWGCTGAKAIRVIRELQRTTVSTVTCHAPTVTVDTLVTLMSRRLKRESSDRKKATERKRRERSRESHGDVTPLSQTHTETETDAETEADSSTTKAGKKVAAPVVLPEWLDDNLWQSFRDHRKEIKAKMTARAEVLALKKLEKFKAEGEDPGAVIEQSIENGWKGLFPVNSGGRGGAWKDIKIRHAGEID